MKNLLFVFLLLSTAGFSQTIPNLKTIANQFADVVNKNLTLFDDSDLKIINESSFPPSNSVEIYWAQLLNLPVSTNFMDGSTEKIKLLEELDRICQPLWEIKFISEEEASAKLKELNDELGKARNGKIAQYLFIQVTFLQSLNTPFLGGSQDDE